MLNQRLQQFGELAVTDNHFHFSNNSRRYRNLMLVSVIGYSNSIGLVSFISYSFADDFHNW